MKTFYAVLTLNGNLVLKSEEKLKESDEVEFEFYVETEEEAKKQFKAYKKELKEEGLL